MSSGKKPLPFPRSFCYMGVSKNRGTPKSSFLIGFSLINHPFWGTPIFGNTHIISLFIERFNRGKSSVVAVSPTSLETIVETFGGERAFHHAIFPSRKRWIILRT